MVTQTTAAENDLKIVEDATCTFCGCVCDDIELTVENNHITKAKRACVLGKAWFLNHEVDDRPSCLIDGRPATLEEGYDLAANILAGGKYPIVYGLSDSPCEAQRKAVSIADWIDGTIDTTTSVCHGPSGMAFQGVGEVTCSLGEVANRGDMIIFWGSNPAESHPRHFTKYSLMPKGMFVPNGRKDRTCVIVDVRKTKSAKTADIFLQIKPRRDFEALWTLRALAKGVELEPGRVLEDTGVELAVFEDLMHRMKAAKFGVIFFGMGLTMTRGKHCNSEALLALTRDMNAFTRFVAKPNRGHGNVTGADNVVSWRTGYPFGVNHSRGYPRFNPGEYTTSDTLANREADCGLIIACDPMANFSQPAREHLASIPYIALDTKVTPSTRAAKIAFNVATYGINTGGTVYRMDDVPIPLRPAAESPHPSDYEVLSQIERTGQSAGGKPMTDLIKIEQATVYDPANDIDGEVGDIWIADGKIVAPPDDGETRPTRTIDARDLVVMPGGIDMHCHIAGPKVNVARKMRPEEKRRGERIMRTANTHSGTMGSVPSTFATGYKYAGLGYTTAFDAAIPPLGARHAHEEFQDTPCIDKGFYVLMGNNHYVMKSLQEKEPQKLKAFVAWLLNAAKGFAPKLVNPGGVEVWKHKQAGNVHGLDSEVDHFRVTPREIVSGVAQAANELGLPHPVHIHCNNLGMPGNWETTLETLKALEGRRGHLTHIQFHSYGGGDGDENTFNSKVTQLADYVNSHSNVTVDVGQVLFGETTSMTGDGPLGYFLSNVYGGKWFSGDTEMEAGCGITPIKYKNKSLVHALQWAIGLEWYLQVEDPWRVVMSTDHPNGGSFLAYPQIIRYLMDRTYRNDVLKTCHPRVKDRSALGDLDREYTLREIAIITRAGPARILGLKNKGHLGIGADADITIYTPHENKETMFELPRMVIKSGQIIVEHGEMRNPLDGKTLHVQPDYDREVESHIQAWFEEFYSIRWRNYPVDASYLHEAEAIS